ncbi:putative cytochrome P450 301a1, mitochondrial isoform X2 [Oratosquilla oratoria]|uniref:putative cytochrome P450 301a1, mitochondrial isoform X2 n=1 Tax=Oratosquilla oratoria TaxID=337810 RepID=UPI003F76F1EB
MLPSLKILKLSRNVWKRPDNCVTICKHGNSAVSTSACKKGTFTMPSPPTDVQATKAKPSESIPGPRRFPIIGSLPTILMHKDMDLKRIYLFWEAMVKEYGPIFRYDLPGLPPMVFTAQVEDVEQVLRATTHNPLRPGFLALKKIRYEADGDNFLKGAGLVPEQGENWWRMRSRVQAPLMKPDNVVHYLDQVDQVTLEFLDMIPSMQNENKEVPEDFLRNIYRWALECIGLVAINRRLGCLDRGLGPDSPPMVLINQANILFDALNSIEYGPPFWMLFPTRTFRKLRRAHEEVTRIAVDYLSLALADLGPDNQTVTDAEGQSKRQTSSFIETLLNTEGFEYSDILTMVLDLLIAGVDTTSHTLGFTLYELAKNPSRQAKLQREVDRVVGKGRDPLTGDQLSRLQYTKAVVRESLRMFPLVMGVARTLDKDVIVGGYVVRKGVVDCYDVKQLDMP